MNKNIVMCVILSIVTFGIYALYWLFTLNDAAIKANPNEWSTGGATVILLAIVTCGIYTYYWNYKMGKAFAAVNGGKDNSVMFILLTIFGLQIVNYCIMQDDINKFMA